MRPTKQRQETKTSAKSGEVYDPRILVFACNWCSYAGADTAGISRLAQTPHFRLLRVMCSGRVHPAFVLRAFARGADGVMVSGCHFGDCHYRFGNYRAVEQYDKLKLLVDMLGLEPERIRLEWISAAEGVRFAQVMNEFVGDVRRAGPSPIAPSETVVTTAPDIPTINASRALSCLECGRCTAVCPVGRYQRFSPRRLISQVVSKGLEALAHEPSLWTCLTCERCSVVCPVQVDYSQFILDARAAAVAAGYQVAKETIRSAEGLKEDSPPAQPAPSDVVPCAHGSVFEQISTIHTRPNLVQRRLGWLTSDLRATILADGERAEGADLLFTGCSPYFAAYFGGETGAGLNETLRSVVRLLNDVKITPALLANERCCGYHMRLSGKLDIAETLEKIVLRQIAESGAKRVVVFCPECHIALRDAAARHGKQVEIIHLSELLHFAWRDREPAALGENGKPRAVTYQDPCRLGRGAGFYDFPRELLTRAGAELTEMAHAREQSICCGNTAWLNCNAGTKAFQAARLNEATATEAKQLVTACPGCYIHLKCAQEGAAEDSAERIAVTDLWSLLASGLPQAGRSKD